MKRIQEYSFYLVVGLLLTWLSSFLHSNYLYHFLKENLVTLLIALLAINTTTSSVVMTKLKEISDANSDVRFEKTISELRTSIYEQIIYIMGAVVLSIIESSELIMWNGDEIKFLFLTLLSSLFVAGMSVLFDTAKSIFVILDFETRK